MIFAVDPGLKGGLAALDPHGHFWTRPMPVRSYIYYGPQKRQRSKPQNHVDAAELHRLCAEFHPHVIVVEQQVAMQGQSSVSTGTSFTNYGLVLSLRLVAPLYIVPARRWKAALAVPRDKAGATKRCRALFPGEETPERDGEAEALLLALYWQREDDNGQWATSTELRDLGARGKAKVVRQRLPKSAGDQRDVGDRVDRG